MHERLSIPELLLVLCAAVSCQAARGEESEAARESEPFVPLPEEEPASIGFFLTQYDRSLEDWSRLKLDASSAREQRALDALERNLEKRARERREELLDAFESGPLAQRRIAAAALGFTQDPSMLSPLLSGVTDPDPEVVQRSLLGIGVLGLPDTPLAEIRFRLLQDPDPWTRNNAAFALLRIASRDGRGELLAETCRAGLLDSEPGVRAQCASALGILSDEQATDALADLVYDEANLVALAAVSALARIGREHAQLKGRVARSLVEALDRVRADRRNHLLGALVWMSDQNLGVETDPWREWAQRLP